ncbi:MULTISPECIES: ABC transporter permease [Rhizobium]|uniref:ABC transporter permease n=1 Tax=Rhizobium tropici TaxID=398 RepID=A0A329YGT7_RHITR|nr:MULTISPECIES: ABC transporter permease [Rhizobium]MBB3289229.1 ABC-type dipeptide/oligopeptide/nickel transport system permease subunit [Rhizobium sp. BK252]MBB3403971.1 ABC-type dipeptide/oligopeptide/nickel transport system permease subunit [Rhizobium sp. BK289]MBB3416360.1 ABC-type dipeptide/oligopeptide/nickel transport system permease subunit [Rhizobium sp. BK284]MBB3484434.1 ABC-type dipeptide/oligopeptide/nickel transport system permease subunit [Rhizobium sp. BK347]MDK4718081.1 ABC 
MAIQDNIAAIKVTGVKRAARPSWMRIFHSKTAIVGLFLVVFWVAAAALAPILPLPSPTDSDVMAMGNPFPSATHWLGTDILGRDVLSRLIFGARTVLFVAPLSVAVAMIVGITMGMVAGYYSGLIDALISRFSDIVLAFPVLVIYVILIANIGPSVLNIVIATTIASSPGIGRITRGLVLSLKEQEYIAAAKLRAESTLYIMLVELLPNCRSLLIVDACLRIGYTIITIGILGFLGLGLPPPNPDWGGMVKESVTVLNVWPLMSLIPSAALVSLVLGFNLLADGMREAWKP